VSASFRAKLALARASGRLSRRSGRGGGTTLPGRLLLRLAPDALARLGVKLTGGSTIVSATNGKTTTAGMITSALHAHGRIPVHNRAGSNMTWGVATALLEQQGTEGLFEVDEAWLPKVAEDLSPGLVVLGNLFRDQLDRYGELEHLADEWAEVVAARAGQTEFALNADDPLVADLGRDLQLRRRPGVTYFGIDDPSQALPQLQHAHDAKHCRRCGAPYVYERAFVGHLGHYTCPNCGADRPRPDVVATRIELHGMKGSRVDITTPEGDIGVSLPLPGVYNVYNALAALTAAMQLGVPLERAVEGLERVEAAFGRVETIAVAGVPVSILLIKNPAGANEVLRTLRLEAGVGGNGSAPGLDLWVALNDRIADGRDVSWVWDADFELLAGQVRRVVCAGTRAPEMAVRLKYAGVSPDTIAVEPEIDASLDRAVALAPERLFALPTYTALLELRTLLADRGLAREYWE
jgi:UDP-N-acetylmuramyl tripeptide synthase